MDVKSRGINHGSYFIYLSVAFFIISLTEPHAPLNDVAQWGLFIIKGK